MVGMVVDISSEGKQRDKDMEGPSYPEDTFQAGV